VVTRLESFEKRN